MTDADSLDKVFKALADPTRRRLLDVLRHEDGQSLNELCEGLSMARQSVTQHLNKLVDADLVAIVRHGRERRHYLNSYPIHEMQNRWTREFDQHHFDVIDAVKRRAEETAMSTTEEFPDFVYVTYIRSTPQQVWDALTDAEITRLYWDDVAVVSDWQVGSTWAHHKGGPDGPADVWGRVLETDPPHKLVFTFQSTNQELDDEGSIASYLIEQSGEVVKLTVTHTNFPDNGLRNGISKGWPAVLAGLKSYLETGHALPEDSWDMAVR
ncbi:ArsR/SmtB family transcription factor [Brevibacterium zhoupengii]|uniref:ArsR/SmtB family transcription factor n=1 Tax=Brevibacterium zhoupengii TaxID=2898795 RepID=UPI001E4FFCF1|nr:metalloregulator ArsR/SmtB family transcription factor [Brevibacterium zhoupengii]